MKKIGKTGVHFFSLCLTVTALGHASDPIPGVGYRCGSLLQQINSFIVSLFTNLNTHANNQHLSIPSTQFSSGRIYLAGTQTCSP